MELLLSPHGAHSSLFAQLPTGCTLRAERGYPSRWTCGATRRGNAVIPPCFPISERIDATMLHLATLGLSMGWPGFRRAWNRGEASALLAMLGFSWFASWLLIATFVWREWIPGWLVVAGWVGCISAILMATAKNALLGDLPDQDTRQARDENFRAAQACYLQASYFEAEKLLTDNLSKQSGDIESALLLVSVYRRTARWEQALEGIEQLQKREMAVRWTREIAVEKERVLRGKLQSKNLPPPTP